MCTDVLWNHLHFTLIYWCIYCIDISLICMLVFDVFVPSEWPGPHYWGECSFRSSRSGALGLLRICQNSGNSVHQKSKMSYTAFLAPLLRKPCSISYTYCTVQGKMSLVTNTNNAVTLVFNKWWWTTHVKESQNSLAISLHLLFSVSPRIECFHLDVVANERTMSLTNWFISVGCSVEMENMVIWWLLHQL